MNSRTSRLRVILVLVAWIAQLCLPAAHAAMMAGAQPGDAAWCGAGVSAALQDKLSALPSEVRRILDPERTQMSSVDDCELLCAASAAPAVPEPVAVSVALRAAGLEPAPAQVVWAPAHARGAPPPVRGPPALA